METKKDAFLIIRLPLELKKKILKKAKTESPSLSAYVRPLLEAAVDGK